MNETNETKLNPCPYCREVWVFFDKYDRLMYRTNCKCGFAWKIGRWKHTEKEAVELWNKKVKK